MMSKNSNVSSLLNQWVFVILMWGEILGLETWSLKYNFKIWMEVKS